MGRRMRVSRRKRRTNDFDASRTMGSDSFSAGCRYAVFQTLFILRPGAHDWDGYQTSCSVASGVDIR